MSDPIPATQEGFIPFSPPSAPQPCQTWYRLIGTLSQTTSSPRPLIIIHGGPGLSHDYLTSLSALHTQYSIPLIFYDQLGTARSTHLPTTRGDEEFWTEALFWAELDNLIAHFGLAEREGGYDVLGHSWGGMMGSTWAGQRPKGLRKLVLANSPATMGAWTGAYCRYKDAMEGEVREVLDKGIREREFGSVEYEEALMKFMMKHTATIIPPEFLQSFQYLKEDDTVSMTMSGPNEFAVTGSLRNWTAAEACKNISVPTLVINGTNEGADDEAIKPFLEGIKDVKWVKFEKSTHAPMYEEPELFFKTVGDWLLEG